MIRMNTGLFAWILPLVLLSVGGGCGKTDDDGGTSGTGGGDPNTNGKGSGAPGGTAGPRFPGSGVSYRPLTPGCGPDTAGTCTGSCEAGAPSTGGTLRPPATLCFAGELDTSPDDPSAVIEQVIETVNGRRVVHLRVTFDPSFVDNTYGEGACCGWPEAEDGAQPAPAPGGGKAGEPAPMAGAGAGKAGKGGHTFNDLVGSDHLELLLTNGRGDTVMDFKIDYISDDQSAP